MLPIAARVPLARLVRPIGLSSHKRGLAASSGGKPIDEDDQPLFQFYSFWPVKFAPQNNEVGDYPRTPAERLAAARKYNLIPEDYQPFEEHEGYGDYPNLKAIGSINRDWYDDFDDPQDMRFYGEPFHIHQDLYSYDKIDPARWEKDRQPIWHKFLVFAGAALAIPIFSILVSASNININYPWKYVEDCGVRYEFPKSASDHHGHH